MFKFYSYGIIGIYKMGKKPWRSSTTSWVWYQLSISSEHLFTPLLQPFTLIKN